MFEVWWVGYAASVPLLWVFINWATPRDKDINDTLETLPNELRGMVVGASCALLAIIWPYCLTAIARYMIRHYWRNWVKRC